MTKHHYTQSKSVHRVLADPLRIRLLESLGGRPQSAKELAAWANVAPERLYYHLAQLEQAGLIEIAHYRPLPGSKVERVYHPAPVEPPGDNERLFPSADVARMQIVLEKPGTERGNEAFFSIQGIIHEVKDLPKAS